jgi:hypothetical protein
MIEMDKIKDFIQKCSDIDSQITKKEEELTEMLASYEKLKHNYDVAVLQFTTDLEKSYAESKDKDISTSEKRVLKAENHSPIAKFKYDLEKFKFDIEMKKIEIRSLIRSYDCMIVVGKLTARG